MKKAVVLSSVVMVCLLIFSISALALEAVFQDDFSDANLNTTKWTVQGGGSFFVESGFLKLYLSRNATLDAQIYANSVNYGDYVVELDHQKFANTSFYYYLDLLYVNDSTPYTRLKFSPSGNNVIIAAQRQGTTTFDTIGTASVNLVNSTDFASFRIRLTNSKIQVFAKKQTESEYLYVGQAVNGTYTYVNSGTGTTRIYIPKNSSRNTTHYFDNFKINRAYQTKKVYADYHGFRYTREHDGQLGNWKVAIKNTNTSLQSPNNTANFNADLIDANGNNQVAAMGSPLVGMQSYNDEDYLEYQILTAKMSGIDGFFYEYAIPDNGLTDSDLVKLQAISENYNFEMGVNWLDAQYYSWITNNADYLAWCTANGKTSTDTAVKTEYIKIVYQKLINWVYDKPNAIEIDNKPVMLQFNGDNNVFNGNTLNTVKGYTYNYNGQSNVTSPFFFLRRAPMGLASSSDPNVQKFWIDTTYNWETYSDGSFGWKPATERAVPTEYTGTTEKYGDERDSEEFARAHVEGMLRVPNNKVNMAGIMPGFDNKYCAAWGAWAYELLDRKNGLTYEKGWQKYLENKDVIDSILVPTWSDHTEGTGIEPLSAYNYRELLTTATYSSQFKGTTNNVTSSDFLLAEKLFELRKEAKYLTTLGFDVSSYDTTLDQLGSYLASGNYSSASTLATQVESSFASLKEQVFVDTEVLKICDSTPVTVSWVDASNFQDYQINVNDAKASIITSKYYDAEITFEYLDQYNFDSGKYLYLLSNPTISPSPIGGNMNHIMYFRYGTGDNQWKTAKVKVSKENFKINGGSIDLYFRGNAQLRNISLKIVSHKKMGGEAFLAGQTDYISTDWSHGGHANVNNSVATTSAGWDTTENAIKFTTTLYSASNPAKCIVSNPAGNGGYNPVSTFFASQKSILTYRIKYVKNLSDNTVNPKVYFGFTSESEYSKVNTTTALTTYWTMVQRNTALNYNIGSTATSSLTGAFSGLSTLSPNKWYKIEYILDQTGGSKVLTMIITDEETGKVYSSPATTITVATPANYDSLVFLTQPNSVAANLTGELYLYINDVRVYRY